METITVFLDHKTKNNFCSHELDQSSSAEPILKMRVIVSYDHQEMDCFP